MAPQVVEGVEPLVVEGVEVEVEVVAVVAVAPAYVTVLVSLTYEWSQESSFWFNPGPGREQSSYLQLAVTRPTGL